MPTYNAAIRLGTTGKQEIKQDAAEVGAALKGAYAGAAQAADQASAASDRQEQKWRRMAATLRDVTKETEIQARINAMVGVTPSGAGSARDSAIAFEAAARQAAALRAILDPLSVAQQRFNQEVAEYRSLAAGGAISTQELADAEALARKRLDETTAAVQRQTGARKGLSTVQRQTLIYTASDIVSSGASGISPAMIALQQGPQVLQAFALEGGKAASSMIAFGGALGVVAVATGVAVAAGLQHRDALKQLDAVAEGVGARLGLTGDQLEALAERSAKAGDVSVASARSMTAAYASTGKIGGEAIETLIGLTTRYAVATGQDAKKATEDLVRTFSDLGKNVGDLNTRIGFLDDRTAQYVRTLLSQNRTTEAQIVVARALEQRLGATTTSVDTLGGAWDRIATKAANAWDKMGAAIDRLLFGGTKAQALAELVKERADLIVYDKPTQMLADALDERIKKARAELAAEKAAQDRAAATAAATTQGANARAAIDSAAPLEAALAQKRAELKTITDAVAAKTVANDAQTQKAVAAIRADIGAMEHGYANAAAQAAALKRNTNDAAAAARKAGQDAKQDMREREELLRRQDQVVSLDLQHQLALARIGGDKDQIAALETQMELRQRIAAYQSAGYAAAQAQVIAERQIGEELLAQYQARVQASLKAVDLASFIPADAYHAKWAQMVADIDDNADALHAMRDAAGDAFDRIGDALANGETSWKSWRDVARGAIQDIVGELIRLYAINPLKNSLFGLTGSDALPTAGSGLLGSIWKGITSIGKNANGTDDWRGGLTWVGERGPELVNLPRGSQVFPSDVSAKMGGGAVVNITVNAQGAGPREVDAIRQEMASLKRELPGLIIQTANDGIKRRMIASA